MAIHSEKHFVELDEKQLRQISDCTAVWRNLEDAKAQAAQVRGSMRWKLINGKHYLLRISPSGAETSLGPESDELHKQYENFHQRKDDAEARLKSMRSALAEQQRLNKAFKVGRAPLTVVRTLAAMHKTGLHQDFLVVGTHAMYAYELAAGVRVESGAVATMDLDLLFDTNRLRAYSENLRRSDVASLIDVFKKADPSFRVKPDQLQTAVNDKGFEIDIIRRSHRDHDPHPLKMSQSEDDFWAVEVSQGQLMVSARKFEHLVIASNGEVAPMRTLHPLDFIRLKKKLSQLPGRDRLKAPKDLLQASVATSLWNQYLCLTDETGQAEVRSQALPERESPPRP